MLIRSTGCMTCAVFLWSVNERAKERLPSRPIYIKNAIRKRDSVFSFPVSPVVIPTVQTADITSKSASPMKKFWTEHKTSVAARQQNR